MIGISPGSGQSMPLLETFKRADEVLLNAVQGIRISSSTTATSTWTSRT